MNKHTQTLTPLHVNDNWIEAIALKNVERELLDRMLQAEVVPITVYDVQDIIRKCRKWAQNYVEQNPAEAMQ